MIRLTVPEDTPTLLAIAQDTGVFKPMEIEALEGVLADYQAWSQETEHRCVCYEEAGRMIGFAYYAPAAMTDRTWYLYWIVVSKLAQARGIGAALLQYVEQDVRNAAGRLLLIETSSLPHYEPTRRFYRKFGYEQEAVLRDFYADGDNLVVFRKRLA